MANTETPWTSYIKDEVRKGPAPFEALVAQAANLVPPGRGFRQRVAQMESIRLKRGTGGARNYSDENAQKQVRIRGGQRDIARGSLRSLISRGILATYEVGGVRMVQAARLGEPSPLRPQVSPWTLALVGCVADGPVEREAAIAHAITFVPEEDAIKKAVQRRASRSIVSKNNGYSSEAADVARAGARAAVVSSLHEMVRRSRLVITERGGKTYIDKGPEWTTRIR